MTLVFKVSVYRYVDRFGKEEEKKTSPKQGWESLTVRGMSSETEAVKPAPKVRAAPAKVVSVQKNVDVIFIHIIFDIDFEMQFL